MRNVCCRKLSIHWWGGEYDGLYANWENDDKIPYELCKTLGVPMYDAHPFVLELSLIHI